MLTPSLVWIVEFELPWLLEDVSLDLIVEGSALCRANIPPMTVVVEVSISLEVLPAQSGSAERADNLGWHLSLGLQKVLPLGILSPSCSAVLAAVDHKFTIWDSVSLLILLCLKVPPNLHDNFALFGAVVLVKHRQFSSSLTQDFKKLLVENFSHIAFRNHLLDCLLPDQVGKLGRCFAVLAAVLP